MKPSFIGIGAQKCASTWLHRVLGSHPQVVLPAVKEIDFFSYRFDHGYRWYEGQFSHGTPGQRTGEVSPSYFHDAHAPARVRDYAPDVKLLLTLRDPVQRAISNHRHEVRLGHLDGEDLSFEAGLANNPMYVEQGLYARHLRNWLRHFPLQQIHVVLMEDIEERPEQVAREVFRFVGVDAGFRPPVLTRRFNVSFANRSQGLVKLKDRVYGLSRAPGMGWLWSAASRVGARTLYRRFNVTDSAAVIPPPCPHTLAALREQFVPDVRELERLLGRDLSPWLGIEKGGAFGNRVNGVGA